MTTPPYPLQPKPMKRSWIERNPLWKIPLGCLTLILLMIVFGGVTIGIVTASFRNSEVYKQAMAQASSHPQVRESIGEPLKAGWFVFGELKVGSGTGSANFSIPVSGPRGHGRIRVIAYRNNDVWRFTLLQVYVQNTSQNIDLLSIQPPPKREF